MLSIKNLQAKIEEKQILRGINLEVKAGEVHAIMGPNGSGKSTLASILAGKSDYEVTEGSVDFEGKDLLELDPEERAAEGLFIAFQDRSKAALVTDSSRHVFFCKNFFECVENFRTSTQRF